MQRKRDDSESTPLTLGKALTSHVRLIVWCKACQHQVEPDIAELVAHHGATMTGVLAVWGAGGRFCRDRGEALAA